MLEYIKKIQRSDNTTLITSNKDMEDIIKKVKSLEDSSLLFKGVSETIQNVAKKKKRKFISMLLVALLASLSGNILAVQIMNWAGEGFVRAG